MQLGVVPCLAAAIVVGGYRAGRRAREADAMRVKLDKTRGTTGAEVEPVNPPPQASTVARAPLVTSPHCVTSPH